MTLAAAAPAAADGLPDGFVHLSDVAPTIRQEMRYFGPDNFTGAPVPGYEAPTCVLTQPAAEALVKLQTALKQGGYGLIVFDDAGPFPPRPDRCDESSMSSLGVEMETDFDCFSPLSATASEEVSKAAQANRKVLLDAMTDAGFVNYPKEWWHYTLGNEPYPDRYFDFDVE